MKNYFYLALATTVFYTGLTVAAEPEQPRLLNKPGLTLEIAQRMAMACVDRQRKENGSPVYVAIYDEGANLIFFLKMDGAALVDATAMLKAEASARFRVPSNEISNWVKDNPGVGHVPGLLGIQGGLPIFSKSGAPLGGIGVSGAASAVDESCAQTGLDAVADYLQ